MKSKIVPKLEKIDFLVPCYFRKKMKVLEHIIIPGYLWKGKGLVLHKDEKNKDWRISHYHSGRLILKYIPSIEIAYEWLMVLRKVCNWNVTLEDLKKDRERIENEVRIIQDQISK
jgi:hypothetical protein